MAQQDNTRIAMSEFEIEVAKVEKAFACKCCKLNSMSIMGNNFSLCSTCLSGVPEHIPREQVVRFAIALRRKEKDERIRKSRNC